MKKFLIAWARGVHISVVYFCLSLVVAAFGFIMELLPPIISVPVCLVFGPVIIYWASRWIDPDMFPAGRPWWRRIFYRDNK